MCLGGCGRFGRQRPRKHSHMRLNTHFVTMDIIQQCLSLAPVPYLGTAFSVFRFIYSSVEQTQESKQQLQALSQTIAQLLSTLNKEYRAGRLVQAKTSTSVSDLNRFAVFTAP